MDGSADVLVHVPVFDLFGWAVTRTQPRAASECEPLHRRSVQRRRKTTAACPSRLGRKSSVPARRRAFKPAANRPSGERLGPSRDGGASSGTKPEVRPTDAPRGAETMCREVRKRRVIDDSANDSGKGVPGLSPD